MINFSIKEFLKDMEELFIIIIIFCSGPGFLDTHVVPMGLPEKGEKCTIMPYIQMTHTTNLVRNILKDLVSDSLSNYLVISCDILSTGLTVRTPYHKNIFSLKLIYTFFL